MAREERNVEAISDTLAPRLPRRAAPVATGPRVLSWDSVKLEFREHLPIWFVYCSAIGLLHAALANYPAVGFEALGIPRWYFIPTLAFPMIIFSGYMAIRIHRSTRLRARWAAWLALGVMTAVIPAVVVFGHRPYPLSHGTLTVLYEGSQFFWVALFVAQILWKRGRWALLMFFGVTFVYGLVLENTGIAMHFFYEPSFHVYLGPLPAPLCTMLGWSLVFYLVIALTQRFASWWTWLKPRPWAKALLATAMALFLDAQLDPLASMSGVFWSWNEALAPAFLGVPAINFAAWTGAFLPFSWMLFRILDRDDLSPAQQNWELFLRVPLAACFGGLICFGIMAIAEGGLDGPTFQILADFQARILPY